MEHLLCRNIQLQALPFISTAIKHHSFITYTYEMLSFGMEEIPRSHKSFLKVNDSFHLEQQFRFIAEKKEHYTIHTRPKKVSLTGNTSGQASKFKPFQALV